MNKARKVAILKRACALARHHRWQPDPYEPVPTPSSPSEEWRTFLTSRRYFWSLIYVPEFASALWGDEPTGELHRQRLCILDSIKGEDEVFAYLADHLPTAKDTARGGEPV